MKKKDMHSRLNERLKVISSVKAPVAFMMPEAIGKLVVRSSAISGYLPITPSYATDEVGVDSIKVLMATDQLITFESFRSKGAIDTAHSHPDHPLSRLSKAGACKDEDRIGEFYSRAGGYIFSSVGSCSST